MFFQIQRGKLLKFCPDIKKHVQLIPGAPARYILPKSNPLDTRDYTKKGLVLLCVGRIHPRKGQHELLQIIEKLPSELKERLTCWFVGPSKHKIYSNKFSILSKRIGCQIQFRGDLSNQDLKEVYEDADIFALTSMPMPNSIEGFGFVYLEASAHGLPILAHNIGGVNDAVLDGKTGLLSAPDKPDQLLENLQKLIEQPEERKALGVTGVKWAPSIGG